MDLSTRAHQHFNEMVGGDVEGCFCPVPWSLWVAVYLSAVVRGRPWAAIDTSSNTSADARRGVGQGSRTNTKIISLDRGCGGPQVLRCLIGQIRRFIRPGGVNSLRKELAVIGGDSAR